MLVSRAKVNSGYLLKGARPATRTRSWWGAPPGLAGVCRGFTGSRAGGASRNAFIPVRSVFLAMLRV